VVPLDATDALCRFARERGLKVHLDGARLFNAAIALGVPAARLVRDVDSVTFCLTKGLACPAGSLVAGSQAFIAEARVCRQALGGGMRQAGCFAAAGIVALDRMIERLAEDHEHARLLARSLAGLGLPVDPDRIDSNMVFFEVPEALGAASEFVNRVRAAGVLINPPKGRRVRLVTHYGIGALEVQEAVRRIGGCVKGLERAVPSSRGGLS
jgi:threonine aldolase